MSDVFPLDPYPPLPKVSEEVVAFHQLIEDGDDDAVRGALASSPRLVRGRHVDGWLPLQTAAFHGRVGIVQILLAHGARADADGSIALRDAALKGHYAVAAVLLEHGAKPSARHYGDTILSVAAKHGRADIVKLLLESGVKVTPDSIVKTARGPKGIGHVEVLKLLIQYGGDINARNRKRYSALCMAAGSDENVHVIRFLLHEGAAVNSVCGPNRATPLHRAALRGQEQVVRLLLEHGADISATDRRGRTAVDMAALSGHESIVRILKGATAPAQQVVTEQNDTESGVDEGEASDIGDEKPDH